MTKSWLAPFVQIFARVRWLPTNGFKKKKRARMKGELWALFLSNRVANAPAAMGSRWRFVLLSTLSLCGMPSLQHVPTNAGLMWCSARLRSQENRECPTDQSCHQETWLHLEFVDWRSTQSRHEGHDRRILLKKRPTACPYGQQTRRISEVMSDHSTRLSIFCET